MSHRSMNLPWPTWSIQICWPMTLHDPQWPSMTLHDPLSTLRGRPVRWQQIANRRRSLTFTTTLFENLMRYAHWNLCTCNVSKSFKHFSPPWIQWCNRQRFNEHGPSIARTTCPTKETRNAFTRGRTDNFLAGVTDLQFPIQVCFSRCGNWFSQFHSHSQPKWNIFRLWPWTMTYDLDLRT